MDFEPKLSSPGSEVEKENVKKIDWDIFNPQNSSSHSTRKLESDSTKPFPISLPSWKEEKELIEIYPTRQPTTKGFRKSKKMDFKPKLPWPGSEVEKENEKKKIVLEKEIGWDTLYSTRKLNL